MRNAASRAGQAPGTRSGPWFPRQHGAWAMLAVPFLLGVSLGPPVPWQIILAATAIAGYLAAATAQAWLRARRPPAFVPSLAVYATTFVAGAALLVVAFPELLWSAAVLVPAGAVVIGGAQPGTPRDLANSVAQVAIALVLVPAAAHLAGAATVESMALATAVAAGYLAGTILVVRSVLRERGNRAYAAASAGYHLVLVAAAATALPWPYTLVALGLAARALILPVIERRRAAASRPLRPVQVGVVEMVASTALVVIAFAVPL